jgi:hypothetical protein
VLGEQPRREPARRVLAPRAYGLGHALGHVLGLRQRRAVLHRHRQRRRQCREREVCGRETIADEVAAPVRQQSADEIELLLDALQGPGDRRLVDVEEAVDVELRRRQHEREDAPLPARDAGEVERRQRLRVLEDLVVQPAPRLDAEDGVEARLERQHLGALRVVAGVQALRLGQLHVGVDEDAARLPEHALGRDQHRNAPAAAGPARRELMDDLDVAALGVLHAGAVERPARLLAEVADRNRDERALRSCHGGRRPLCGR